MGGLRNKQYRKYYLAILFAIALILLPTHQAHAGWLEWGFEAIFGNVIYVIFTLVGKIVGVLAIALNWVIHIPVYPSGGLEVVDASWAIMRDFANMFFIIALIVMAFATIFNITKYEARTLFPKFLISALLINFSLVLGTLVIDASQILSNTFLTAIGDMSLRLGQDLNPSQLLPSEGEVTAAVGVDSAVFGTMVSLVFSVILLFTFLFSLLTAFLFALIRIPILWALLVVSPIAWVLNIFPAGQNTYKKWWSLFIGWNMFLPIFLFFMYFGLYFLSKQDDVIQKIAAGLADERLASGVPFSFQLLFFYVLAAIFLIGGTICAMKASMFSGTGVVSVAKWSRGVAARRIGLTAAGTAARQRLDQIQKEGLPGGLGKVYGGQYASDQQVGRFGQAFGVRGAGRANEKAFVDRAGKEFETIQSQYDSGKITLDQVASSANSIAASTPQGFAYRKFAAKMGRLDPRTFETTLKGLANSPYAAQDFIKTAKESKFATVPPNQIIEAAAGKGAFSNLGPNALPARRELYKHIQSDGRMLGNKNFTAKEFDTGIQLLGGDTSAEGGAYLRDVGKVRPDLVADYHLNPAHPDRQEKLAAARGGILPSRDKLMEGSLSDPKDIASIPKDVWNDGDFKVALKRKINFGSPKARNSFKNRLYDNLRTAFDADDKKKVLDELTGGMSGEGLEGEDELELEGGGGGTPPPKAGPGTTTPPRTGGGGQIGFRPTASTQSQPPSGVSPGNVVDLRNPK